MINSSLLEIKKKDKDRLCNNLLIHGVFVNSSIFHTSILKQLFSYYIPLKCAIEIYNKGLSFNVVVVKVENFRKARTLAIDHYHAYQWKTVSRFLFTTYKIEFVL